MIIVEYFQTQILMLSFLKAKKKMSWILMTQKMIKKEDHCMRGYVLFKEWLQKK
jgi:hypothetical protein